MIVHDRGRGVHTPTPPSAIPPDMLTPEHRHQLEVESGIPADLIAEEDVRSVESVFDLPAPSETVKHPDSEKGKHFRKVPSVEGGGILFPFPGPDGNPLSWQFKPDRPRLREDGKPVKYESPRGARLSLYIPRRVRRWLRHRSRRELWITEGVKKVLAAVGQGYCTIGLAGVDAWCMNVAGISVPLPEWDDLALAGWVVFIAFDSDAVTKPEVQAAERRLATELRRRGAVVFLVRIPAGPGGAKQGLDDYIATGEDVEDLRVAALAAGPIGPAIGGDGAAVCDGSDERCPTSQALRDQLHVCKAEGELLRHGPVPKGEALVLAQLTRVRDSALSLGLPGESLFVPEVAKTVGVGQTTVTRAFNQVRRWQKDPTTAHLLPFTIGEADDKQDDKTHLRLVVQALDGDAERGRTRARALLALARMPRDAQRAQHGGERVRCPKHPDAPLVRTRHWRCTEDGCSWSHQDVVRIGGAPDQDGPLKDESKPDQDGPAPALIPVSFTSRADQEAAVGPHYQIVDGLPEDPPDPPEPLYRCAWTRCRKPVGLHEFACADCRTSGPLLEVAGGEA